MSYTHTVRLPALDPLEAYRRLRGQGPSLLMESGVANSFTAQSGRFSLIAVLPSARLTVGADSLHAMQLEPFGEPLLRSLGADQVEYVAAARTGELTLRFTRTPHTGDERERFTRPGPSAALRTLLERMQTADHPFYGLYGAFCYDFVRSIEDLQPPPGDGDACDAQLLLIDTVVLINHLTGESQLICTQASQGEALLKAQRVVDLLERPAPPPGAVGIGPTTITPSAEVYEQQVAQGIALCEAGELLEIVLARQLEAALEGDPLTLYDAYRRRNPSPYQFYLDFGAGEVLLGTSPELMVQVEGRRVTLRPISGSSARGQNAIDDHRLMLDLLNDEKEKSELDMLIDLGRNDLARVCRPGVVVDDYRVVEKYARVMHTVAQLSGELDAGAIGYDALVAALPAGTLTGAPKVAAMRHIDAIEGLTRGYYGGAIGYLAFSGDVNTAIIIRSAHLSKGKLRYLAGATILVESQPERERRETELKMAAFVDVLQQFTPQPTTA